MTVTFSVPPLLKIIALVGLMPTKADTVVAVAGSTKMPALAEPVAPGMETVGAVVTYSVAVAVEVDATPELVMTEAVTPIELPLPGAASVKVTTPVAAL